MTAVLCAVVMLSAIGVAGLTGCGSDASSEAETQKPRGFEVWADTTMTTAAGLTKAAFIARINEICRRKWPKIQSNFVLYGNSLGARLSDTQRYVKTVRLSFMAGLVFYVFDAMYNLGAPPGEERLLEEMIGSLEESAERTQQGLRPIRSPQQLEAHFATYNRLARAYGLEDCLVAGAHLPPRSGAPGNGLASGGTA